MTLPHTIKIESCSLKRQRILSTALHELELGDQAITLRMIFRAEEQKDEGDPWLEVDNDVVLTYRRDRFCSLKKIWVQEVKRWEIIVSFVGSEDLYLFFKRQAECDPVFQQLLEYFFPS